MIGLIWHIFFTVWITGFAIYCIHQYTHSSTRQLRNSVEKQALQTRMAELQARERKALDA